MFLSSTLILRGASVREQVLYKNVFLTYVACCGLVLRVFVKEYFRDTMAPLGEARDQRGLWRSSPRPSLELIQMSLLFGRFFLWGGQRSGLWLFSSLLLFFFFSITLSLFFLIFDKSQGKTENNSILCHNLLPKLLRLYAKGCPACHWMTVLNYLTNLLFLGI